MTETSRALREPIGWPLLSVPDADGAWQWPDLATSVRQQIEVILSTRPGEQLMRPVFGGGLDLLLAEPNTLATRARIHEIVTSALARWEPRIEVDAVAVDPMADDPAAVRVEIFYRLKRTNAPARAGVTLLLGAAA